MLIVVIVLPDVPQSELDGVVVSVRYRQRECLRASIHASRNICHIHHIGELPTFRLLFVIKKSREDMSN